MVRVLLIEDNAGDVELLRKRLVDVPGVPFQLTAVDTLADGLAAYGARQSDVVLLDLNLPDSGGLATVDSFRAEVSDAPLVVLTGTADLETAVEALRRGADDYIPKGDLSTELLTRTIRYAIERRRMVASLDKERRTVALLQDVGATLASQLELERLVNTVTDVATRLVGAAYGAFFYNDTTADGGALVLQALAGAPRSAFENLGMPRATPIFAPTLRGEAPVRIDDLRLDPRSGREAPHHGLPPGHPPVVSYLAVPLVLPNGTAMGGLFFGHPERARFTAEHERLAVGVAGWASVAVDNARLYEEALRATQARENLLQVVSHDLRNHVNTMSLGLETLRGNVAPEGERRFEAVKRASGNMRRLLEDLVDAAAIEKGVLSVEPKRVSARALVEEARAVLTSIVEKKRLTLELRPFGPDVEVWADRDRVLQVFGNLVGNAVKFTPPHGRIVLAAKASDDEVVLSVEDTGPGIPAEDRPRLFDRFFRGSRPNGHGAGLGLAITRALVQAHGGRIWVTSELGQGTTFSFVLRRAGADADSEAAP